MDTNLVDQIRERWLRIQEKISNAANKAKRNPNDITVVVVSKLQAIEKVEAAVQCGLSIFGENYPELAVEKILHFVSNPVVNWHMIGHMQSRKIPVVASQFPYGPFAG